MVIKFYPNFLTNNDIPLRIASVAALGFLVENGNMNDFVNDIGPSLKGITADPNISVKST